MLAIGITGGIGSGKSTACRIFNVLGVPVFQADSVARRLQDEDPTIRNGLTELFGSEIYASDGSLNRRALATIVFNNKELLDRVNKIVHPLVRKQFDQWKKNYADLPYVLYEAAILFETGNSHVFDFTILVLADEQERMERVMKRDATTAEAIAARMSHQMKDSEKAKLADFIIENNDNQLIIPEILKLDKIFKLKSHVWKMDR